MCGSYFRGLETRWVEDALFGKSFLLNCTFSHTFDKMLWCCNGNLEYNKYFQELAQIVFFPPSKINDAFLHPSPEALAVYSSTVTRTLWLSPFLVVTSHKKVKKKKPLHFCERKIPARYQMSALWLHWLSDTAAHHFQKRDCKRFARGWRPELIPDFLRNHMPVDAVTSRFCPGPVSRRRVRLEPLCTTAVWVASPTGSATRLTPERSGCPSDAKMF